MKLPKYQSHKIVGAAVITGITSSDSLPGYQLQLGELGTIDRSTRWMNKHEPQIGGYLVEYEPDGYLSYSPAGAFEAGYRLISGETQEQLQERVNGHTAS